MFGGENENNLQFDIILSNEAIVLLSFTQIFGMTSEIFRNYFFLKEFFLGEGK
jgi:hypothetical protein